MILTTWLHSCSHGYMSKWTTVRVDKGTAERLRSLAGGGSVASLLEKLSLGETRLFARPVDLRQIPDVNYGLVPPLLPGQFAEVPNLKDFYCPTNEAPVPMVYGRLDGLTFGPDGEVVKQEAVGTAKPATVDISTGKSRGGRGTPRRPKEEPEVQRDTPAYVDVRPVEALTPGAEASKCGDCGRMMARPEKYGPDHFRTCGRWTAPKAVEPPAF